MKKITQISAIAIALLFTGCFDDNLLERAKKAIEKDLADSCKNSDKVVPSSSGTSMVNEDLIIRKIPVQKNQFQDINCSKYINKEYQKIETFDFPQDANMEDIIEYKEWLKKNKSLNEKTIRNNSIITYCWQNRYFQSLINLGTYSRDHNISINKLQK